MSDADTSRYRSGTGNDEPLGDLTLKGLRPGYLVDYEMETWEVVAHETYNQAGWPADVWTLENGADRLYLEHDYDEGDVFRLFEPADITEVQIDGEPFLSAVRGRAAPSTITYRDTEYVLAEEDARIHFEANAFRRSRSDSWITGVCGGLADYLDVDSNLLRVGYVLGLVGAPLLIDEACLLVPALVIAYIVLAINTPKEPPPSPREQLSHYWVYKGNGDIVALECIGSNDWNVFIGRTVEPYEFDNILPRSAS